LADKLAVVGAARNKLKDLRLQNWTQLAIELPWLQLVNPRSFRLLSRALTIAPTLRSS
jgi:hypothetical protein